MAFNKLVYEYHDSTLESCQFGPRRELNLQILLDPVWNPQAPQRVTLHFTAIENFDEVREFFKEVQLHRQTEESIDGILACVNNGKGKWLIELERNGSVAIVTFKKPCEG